MYIWMIEFDNLWKFEIIKKKKLNSGGFGKIPVQIIDWLDRKWIEGPGKEYDVEAGSELAIEIGALKRLGFRKLIEKKENELEILNLWFKKEKKVLNSRLGENENVLNSRLSKEEMLDSKFLRFEKVPNSRY